MKNILSTLSRPETKLLLFVCFLSYFTIVHKYWNPPNLFWDENYHVASAQKYLNGIAFMEPHPPLGKLVIAAGEWIVDANPGLDNDFIGTDYGKDLPEGFSFLGYRLFPTLLTWLTVPILFGIFFILTRSALLSTLLSSLYIFDNALIVHARSAMLDSTLLFFILLNILTFLLCMEWEEDRKKFRWVSLLYGLSFAGALATKANGLIIILLLPFLCFFLNGYSLQGITTIRNWKPSVQFLKFALPAFLIPYLLVWYTHFAIGTTVNPSLPDSGYYQYSVEAQQIIDEGRTHEIATVPLLLSDSLDFLPHYSRGVPRLDLCKPDENGSPFYFWPLGGRSINYRWETADNGSYQYLYLQVNPVIWWASVAAVLIGIALLILPYLFPLKKDIENRFLLTAFTTLYLCYMIAISRLDRVMYLYHYFVPLVFSFLILAIVYMEIQQFRTKKVSEAGRTCGLLAFALLIFAGYQAYRPFTYYEPIRDDQVTRRAIFPLWELHCVRCDKKSGLVIPREK